MIEINKALFGLSAFQKMFRIDLTHRIGLKSREVLRQRSRKEETHGLNRLNTSPPAEGWADWSLGPLSDINKVVITPVVSLMAEMGALTVIRITRPLAVDRQNKIC